MEDTLDAAIGVGRAMVLGAMLWGLIITLVWWLS